MSAHQQLADLVHRLWVTAVTVWREAQGESYEGKVAIARVIGGAHVFQVGVQYAVHIVD